MAGRALRYAVAGGAFVVLMAAGIGVGQVLTGPAPRLDPVDLGTLEVPGDTVRLVAVGSAVDGPTRRHVGERIRRWCAEEPCTAVLLLGDAVPDPEDAEDPGFEALRGWTDGLGAPVLRILGERDQGGTADPRRAAWHRDASPLPAATWTATAGPVGLWGLDTTELRAGDVAAQRAWLDRTVRASGARWRLALAHQGDHAALADLADEALCGRVDLVLTGDTAALGWTERCGTGWLVAGTGGGPGHVDAPDKAIAWSLDPGFLALDLDADTARIRLVDAGGRIVFDATRRRDGAVVLPDDTLLQAPEAPARPASPGTTTAP